MKPLVKVCGLTKPEQAVQLDALGLDFLGFVFAARSRRRVAPGLVAAIPRGRAKRVGVFAGMTADEVLAVLDQAGLDYAQLHDDQDPDFCRRVGPDRVIRTFWPQRHASRADLEAEIARFAHVCAFVLLDAGTAGGGHGKSLDFAFLSGLLSPRPWLLAGGLSPDNVAQAARLAAPDGFDLNSGVESAPGVKDPALVRLALERLNRPAPHRAQG